MIGRSALTLFGRSPARPARRARRSSVALLLAGAVLAAGTIASAVAQAPPARPAPAPKGKPAAPVPAADEPPVEPLPPDLPPAQEEPEPGKLVPRRPARAGEPRAPVDAEARPAAIGEPPVDPAEDAGKGPLPGATPAPGGGGAAPGAGGDPADSFTLKPDRIAPGKQQVRLAVEVKAAEKINLGKETPVRIVVTNDGSADAYGVTVVYQLPESLEYVSCEQPPAQHPTNPQIYTWNKAMMAAGGEWSIGLKVKAKDTKSCEHVASVTARAGSKVGTIVQEPKLKVDAIPKPGRVQKGGPVNFDISVTNHGTGPARNVNVLVKLSDGLRLGEDDLVEQTIDVIEPGKKVQLENLRLDTVAGGMQACDITVTSPDVNTVAADQKIQRAVEVTAPELDVQLTGQDVRYTGQPIEYKLTVTNTGTAATKNVQVSVALPPEGGKLRGQEPPDGANFSAKERKLLWKLPPLAPKQSFESSFVYDTSTPRPYRCTAEASSGPLRVSKVMTTEVTGMADLDLKVTQTDRVVDVGKSIYYDFVLKNVGTKEATQILCSGDLTNLKIIQAFKGETTGEFEGKDGGSNKPTQFVFPPIPRLAAGQSMTLSLEVQALKRGRASASVVVAFDGMAGDDAVKGAITTTVTDNNGPTARAGGAR